MSIRETEVMQRVARTTGRSVDEIRAIVRNVAIALADLDGFGQRANEIRHATDWTANANKGIAGWRGRVRNLVRSARHDRTIVAAKLRMLPAT